MNHKSNKKAIFYKFWRNNISLVPLLGLCPVLTVTSSATAALGLGLITTLVLMLSNFFISLLRKWIPVEIRIPIYVMIIATIVNLLQMAINAWAFSLYQLIGIFIPLIITNCIIVSRAEIFAYKNTPIIALFDGFSAGISVTGTMFLLGSIREIFGNGTLFNDMNILLGNWAKILRIEILQTNTLLLLAILPPGVFISLGIIMALKYLIDKEEI